MIAKIAANGTSEKNIYSADLSNMATAKITDHKEIIKIVGIILDGSPIAMQFGIPLRHFGCHIATHHKQ
jgi:hypothetical protein